MTVQERNKRLNCLVNLDPNNTWCVIDLIYDDEVYVGSYDDCCEFIKEHGIIYDYSYIIDKKL